MTVVFPDPELWLCGHLRDALRQLVPNVFVGRMLPTPMAAERWYVAVRFDGSTVGQCTEDASYGFTLSGPAGKDVEASALARLLQATVNGCPSIDPHNPFVAARCGGPMRVPSQTRCERYLTATMTLVASTTT